MIRRKQIGIALALLAVASALVWWLARPKEPNYQGKSFRYWIKAGTSDEASVAFRSMGEKVIPYLVKELEWKPSPMVQSLHRRFPNFPLTLAYVQGSTDPRSGAAYALGEIGPPARSAISNLQALSVVSDLPSSWYVNLAAKGALIKIRQEPLTPYVEKLKDKSDITKWYQNALMIGEFGTNASPAVPLLVEAMGGTNHPVIQAHAAIALGMIHSRPELCILPLANMLKSSDVALRQKAIFALPQFGSAARPAWDDIVTCLQDSDPWTRYSARAALKKIDPEAARKAGVK